MKKLTWPLTTALIGLAAILAIAPSAAGGSTASYSYRFYTVQGANFTVQPASVAQGFAECHHGDAQTGGGFSITNSSGNVVPRESDGANIAGNGGTGQWVVVVDDNSQTQPYPVEISVDCVHRVLSG